MSIATAAVDLRCLSDDELLAVYAADPDDDVIRAAALAEAARRDRLEQAAREREQVRAAWYDAAYAAYLQAEADCNGELVNRAGVAAGVRDGFALWSGPRHYAMAYATDELREWWDINGRLTIGEYRRQHAAAARDARLEAMDAEVDADAEIAEAAEEYFAGEGWAEADPASGEITTTATEEITDEQVAEFAEVAAERLADAAMGAHEGAGLRRVGAADTVRPGRDGQQPAVPQAGQVRDAGPVFQSGQRVMRSFAEVAPRETMLLSRRPYLVYGDVALIYGAGSLGKGRAVWSIVAAVTRGEPIGLDTDTNDDAGDVIVILPEDKTDESAVKRLVASGANPRRVWDMTRLPSGVRFKLSASDKSAGHLPELRAAVEQLRADGGNPRLVVIDPIGACVGDGTIQTSKGARLFVERLQDFAEATGVCVLLVAHPVGSGKLQGSHALEQALRAVFYVRRDETDANLRVLSCVKGNDVPPDAAGDIRFAITEGPNGPRVEWVTTEQAASAHVQTRTPDWRNDLAARRSARAARTTPAAPVTPQQAKAAGCRHSHTKYGTPAQCSDCPAARLSAPRTPSALKPAARPAVTYRAAMAVAGRGTAVLASGMTDQRFARMLCEATPEAKALAAQAGPLQWTEARPGVWVAANAGNTIAWAIAAEGTVRVA